MATAWRSKWLDWKPGDEIISVFPQTELTKLTKPTSVSFVNAASGETQIISAPTDHPDAWREDFARWKAESCIHREGRDDSGGVGCLWVDFCEWAARHDSVRCDRSTFERLLADEGFRCVEGMVAGLALRVDLDAALRPQLTQPGVHGPAAKFGQNRRGTPQ